MSSGLIPTYEYRPPARPGVSPILRTCSSRRARLFAGGTYFRAREPGLNGNRITIEVPPPVVPGVEAYCVITNTNLKFDENVIGPVRTKILDLKGTYQDLWIMDQLNSPTPQAKKYSISLRIAFRRQEGLSHTLPTPVNLGRFTDGKLFVQPGKLSVKTEKTVPNFTSGHVISIAPRTRIYKLSYISVTDPVTSAVSSGWDIDDLRDQVNASDPWVEMLERSGPTDDGMGGPPVPNPNPPDVQDDGTDDPVLLPFSARFMKGGDGLPASPSGEITGPSRSLVHVNFGERKNGSLGETNTIYEWVGNNSIAGSWRAY